MKITKFVLAALALLAFLPTRPARADQIKTFAFVGLAVGESQPPVEPYFNVVGWFDIDLTTYAITSFNFDTVDCCTFVSSPGVSGYIYGGYDGPTVGIYLPNSDGEFMNLQFGGTLGAFLQSGGALYSYSSNQGDFIFAGSAYPTPEPSTLTLLATGLLGLFGLGAIRAKQIRYQSKRT